MLTELNTASANKVVGAKQVRRAFQDGRVEKLFLAHDADPRVTQPLGKLAEEAGVPVITVPSMKELGTACGIAVGSAAAALLK